MYITCKIARGTNCQFLIIIELSITVTEIDDSIKMAIANVWAEIFRTNRPKFNDLIIEVKLWKRGED